MASLYKSVGEKKPGLKITYPPPADALCVVKKCKALVRCNLSLEQAWSGPARARRHCTLCKELKGCAAEYSPERPHSVHIYRRHWQSLPGNVYQAIDIA